MNTLMLENETELDSLRTLLWGEETVKSIVEVIKGVRGLILLLLSFVQVMYIVGRIIYSNTRKVYTNLINSTTNVTSDTVDVISDMPNVMSDEVRNKRELEKCIENLEYNVLSKLEYKITIADYAFVDELNKFYMEGGKWLSSEWINLLDNSVAFCNFVNYVKERTNNNDELINALKECHEDGEGYPRRYTFSIKDTSKGDMLITMTNIYLSLINANY